MAQATQHSARQKLYGFCAQHRSLLAVLLAGFLAALVAAWAGFDLSSRVDHWLLYRIVNDDYTQVVEIPRAEQGEAGLAQEMILPPGETLYGVRLDFSTYDYAFQSGTVHAVLCDAAGQPLAEGTVDCITLRDNTFADLVFSTAYTADTQNQNGKALRLLLWYTAPLDADRPLGLWASEGVRNGLGLYPYMGKNTSSDFAQTGATAAFQFITADSGQVSRGLSAALGVLIVATVCMAMWLLRGKADRVRTNPDGKNGASAVSTTTKNLRMAAVLSALLLGLAFSFVTPPLVAPDEYTHLARSYALSSQVLGSRGVSANFADAAPQGGVDTEGYLIVRSADKQYIRGASGDIGIFAYQRMAEHLADTGCGTAADAETDIYLSDTVAAGNLCYLPQTLGLVLGRLAGLGFFGCLLLGRLCNLLWFVLLADFALRWAPKNLQTLMACVMLLPITLQMAASFSVDATILGLVFCYTALCLALRVRPARTMELIALLVLALVLAPSKAIYLPVVLLILLVPAQNLCWKKPAQAGDLLTVRTGKWTWKLHQGLAVKTAALVLATLRWAVQNGKALIYATRDVDNVGLTRGALALLAAAILLAVGFWAVRKKPWARKVYLGVLAAAVCVGVPVVLHRLTHMWGGLTPEDLVGSVQENGDSIYTYSVGYICRNLPATIKLLLRSVSSQGALWLQGILGTALGEPIVYGVYVSWALGVALVVVLFTAAMRRFDEPCRLALPQNMGQGERSLRRGRVAVAGIVTAVVLLTVLAALTWTPINYQTIFGVQGRYWLPILPLMLVLLGETRAVALQRDLTKQLVPTMVVLTSLALLQGYGLYAAWDMAAMAV